MNGEHAFWLTLVVSCLVWYSTITVYVAVRGGRDIREMLARLHANHPGSEDPDGTGRG